MGIIKISRLPQNLSGLIGVWDMSETCSTLLNNFSFSEKEQQEFSKITSNKRKCEFLTVRLLLEKMMQKKKELYYSNSGKPFIEENIHITISHSSELAVILLTDKQAGVDVENLQRNTDKVASRFLSNSELEHIDKTPDPAFTRIVYWCAKEALYKCSSQPGIDFKKQLYIKPFLPAYGGGIFSGQLIKNNQLVNFTLHYLISNNNVIVYCIEEDNV